MTNNTQPQLPDEVVEKILRARDALVLGDRDEAYHQIYGIACPGYDSYFPWHEMEKQINYPEYSETEIKNRRQVTEYATKLHEAQQEVESLTNQLKNHAKVSNENMKLLRQENEKARTIIEKLNAKYGALHHESLANEIKQFLDGK